MDILSIVIIVLIIAAAALGLIIGLVKGFSNVSSWGAEYVLACLFTILIGGAVKNGMGGDANQTAVAGIISIALGVAFVLLFGATSAICRAVFRGSKKRKIAEGGKEKGASGFMDRIFGGVTLAVKGVVIVGVVAAFILVALDLAQLQGLNSTLGGIWETSSYLAFKPYILDCLYIGLVLLALKCGFHSGISSVLWGFLVLGMVVFAGLASYNLAFNVESFSGAVNSLAGLFAGGGEITGTSVTIAQWALTAIMFLLMCVVIVLVAIFVPKLLGYARNSKIFYAIDGAFGALFAVTLVLGILLVLGSIVQPLAVEPEKYAFMAEFTSYFENSAFATFFYDNDVLSLMGMPPILPVTEWLG
ncbi:MAG: hypothetical protein K2N30_01930 [Clostridia bacterium]|nr:hypothetical protein [Clostridia bacterium]